MKFSASRKGRQYSGLNLFVICLILSNVLFSCAQDHKADLVKQEQKADLVTEEEALQLLHDWTQAYLDGNAEPLNDILDPSWVYSGSADGKTTSKAQNIAEFSTADYSIDAIDYKDLKVAIYDDIAVLRGIETMVILDSSRQDSTILTLRFTDVYKKKDGVLRAISTHSSPVEE